MNHNRRCLLFVISASICLASPHQSSHPKLLEPSTFSQRSLIRSHASTNSLSQIVVDYPGHVSGRPHANGGTPPVLLMVLTYANSPRLHVAMRTWIPDCAARGFDIALYVSEPKSSHDILKVPTSLGDRVQFFNTYHKLKKPDSRGLERWKTWAFMRELGRLQFNHSLEPLSEDDSPSPYNNRHHEWFIQLDDDSLPMCEKIQDYVNLQQRSQEAMYIGLDKNNNGFWNDGCFTVLSRVAMDALITQLAKEPLRARSEADKCTPAYDKYKLTKAYQDKPWEADCCVMEPMVYADVLIGSCLHRAGIQATAGSDGFYDLYQHGLKQADELESAYKKLYFIN